MKFGFIFPKANVLKAIEFAQEAENAGWDGFFVWEPIYGVDAWVTLSAIACNTQDIRIGTMITPVSRMRPWKLASELITLDNISKGRVNLSVALGAIDTGFAEFGEEIDRKTRAELLDEGLEIITRLWKGSFSFTGKHYNIRESSFFKREPPPSIVQKPNIPIWVVAAWPRMKSIQRALKFDGIIPSIKTQEGKFDEVTPEHIKQIKDFIDVKRSLKNSFDIIVEGTTPLSNIKKGREIVQPFEEAGATWWIESMWFAKNFDTVLERIRNGPPK
ncbi:MAG: LLM class flavin-dependent oxidoreductase [Candidatus Heimdallarchaeota archaeon]|nr:LLM class flavin-dependent oxidoreductase [Candidatus Heimdallarchaeota archaeon]